MRKNLRKVFKYTLRLKTTTAWPVKRFPRLPGGVFCALGVFQWSAPKCLELPVKFVFGDQTDLDKGFEGCEKHSRLSFKTQ